MVIMAQRRMRNYGIFTNNNQAGTLGYNGQMRDCHSQTEILWMFGISF